MVTDLSQAVVWQTEQTPFGEVTQATGTLAQPLRFPGQYADPETGYSYNYFRDYDPSVGRYVQSDPIGLRGGLNSYVYANLDPNKNIDPNGLDVVTKIGKVIELLDDLDTRKGEVETADKLGDLGDSIENCPNPNSNNRDRAHAATDAAKSIMNMANPIPFMDTIDGDNQTVLDDIIDSAHDRADAVNNFACRELGDCL